MTRTLAVVALLAATQVSTRPSQVTIPGTDIVVRKGWRLSIDSGCRSAVPVDWRVEGHGFFSSSSGWRLTVTSVPMASWSVHKGQVRSTFDTPFGTAATTHEDSDRRLWIESRQDAMVQHYVAVHGVARACVGVLEIPLRAEPSDDTVGVIVESIAMAPTADSE